MKRYISRSKPRSYSDDVMKRLPGNPILGMAKEPSRGVFWIVDGELLAYPFMGQEVDGVAKSGNTFNHKKLWPAIKPNKCNKPYNYYPRGRVDMNNQGQAVIYLNPNINESYIPKIKVQFGLRSDPKIYRDYSAHYKCYLDQGWKPDD